MKILKLVILALSVHVSDIYAVKDDSYIKFYDEDEPRGRSVFTWLKNRVEKFSSKKGPSRRSSLDRKQIKAIQNSLNKGNMPHPSAVLLQRGFLPKALQSVKTVKAIQDIQEMHQMNKIAIPNAARITRIEISNDRVENWMKKYLEN